MKSYLFFILLLLSSFPALATIQYEQYKSVTWQELKIDNPDVKNVFINVYRELDRENIVIPAFIVKSWMKGEDGQSIYFLSAQPYVCEHSPPPYANQMIKIHTTQDLESIADNGTPIYAFGNVIIEANKAGLFSSAYTIQLDDILPYTGVN